MTRMFDSVDVNTIPGYANGPAFAVAGYVGGYWPTYSPECKAFPKAHHVSIAVNSGEDAMALDVESGDAVPAQAGGWTVRQRNRGVIRPILYSSTSSMPAVIDNLTRAGLNRSDYRVWTAHYTYSPHVEPGSDATQWTDHSLGRNLDESLAADTMFGAVPQPQRHATNPLHYERFDKGPFLNNLNERQVVIEYDQARKHPFVHRPRLKVLREELAELAGRVYNVAHQQADDNGKPAWAPYFRGWRYQQLIRRSHGVRFA